mmetsp:Transcript_10987/g.20210  ORF Transcript_10987/g.20210 Transcript_10987/m.20210 type:complete len:610 (-) Transcript_10987:219-2048(-)|eukprot:CAMPEP_0197535878 /NCGR_PEP_ID=MMETSP1318-20131121/52054_1 /TAXON_ID=552666 /ORGANISM="Partenskyella glossopodia, Strain RCC365" /LENGTH=609 /DNA_ID=CAMNT_0043093591 /DNA_START=11 /DNA_END=1840 /DNA_ORIENTATION=+
MQASTTGRLSCIFARPSAGGKSLAKEGARKNFNNTRPRPQLRRLATARTLPLRHTTRPALLRGLRHSRNLRLASTSSGSGSRTGNSGGGFGRGLLYASGGLACLGGLGLALKYSDLFSVLLESEEGLEPEVVQLMEEPEPFVHPFEKKSWVYKAYVRTKRAVWLAVIFTPCAVMWTFAEWTESDEWRSFWIKMLVSTVELSGCSVQKFAQWCSMRPDMFEEDIIKALSKLRCDAPAHDFAHTRKSINEAFGRDIEDIFETFEEEPVASGTVAQVHRARLKPEFAIDGKVRDVAVKVQHPRVLEETFFDVDLLFHVIDMTPKLTIPMKKDDFMMVLQRQTNFEWEAYNLKKFAKNFAREKAEGKVKFPVVSVDLLSPTVLIESWADGSTVSNFFSSMEKEISDVGQSIKDTATKIGESVSSAVEERKKDLARTIFLMNIKMFLRDNLIHSDMHAGNILYSEETGELTVLDAGQTASLEPEAYPKFGKFLHCICKRDKQGVFQNLLDFDQDRGANLENKEAFYDDVSAAIDKYCPDGEMIIVGDIMGQLLFALNKHNLCLRSDVSVSLMSMAVSEGLIKSLDPDFDLVGQAMPYIAKYGAFKNKNPVKNWH